MFPSEKLPVLFRYISILDAIIIFLQRKRYFWRVDSKSITLYQQETGSKYYKVFDMNIYFIGLMQASSL